MIRSGVDLVSIRGVSLVSNAFDEFRILMHNRVVY